METGEWPHTPGVCLGLLCGGGELQPGRVVRGKKNPLLSSPMPLLYSVKQHEALFVLSLGPVSLLKMKTKFSFKRGELG